MFHGDSFVNTSHFLFSFALLKSTIISKISVKLRVKVHCSFTLKYYKPKETYVTYLGDEIQK